MEIVDIVGKVVLITVVIVWIAIAYCALDYVEEYGTDEIFTRWLVLAPVYVILLKALYASANPAVSMFGVRFAG